VIKMFILKLILWFLIGYSIYKISYPTVKIFIDKKDQKDYQKTLDEEEKIREEYEKNLHSMYQYKKQEAQERVRMRHQCYYMFYPKELKIAPQIFQTPLPLLMRMSDDDLKKLYRKKSKIYHPDCGGNPENFKLLVSCYKYIKNLREKQRI